MADNRALNELKRVLLHDSEILPVHADDVRYKRQKIRVGAALVEIGQAMYAKALGSYFCSGDIKGFKQNCYVSSRAYLESAKYDGGEKFATAHSFLVAILSDNLELVNAFAKVSAPESTLHRNNPHAIESHIYLIQLALRGEDTNLQKHVHLLRQQSPGKGKDVHDLQEFFLLLAGRDKDALERLIQEKHARIKSAHPYERDLMSFLGCLETKLCWLRDIPVEINHPLVPMALMPIQPLPNYDDVFDFLRPDWAPPPQGPLADALRWFQKRRSLG